MKYFVITSLNNKEFFNMTANNPIKNDPRTFTIKVPNGKEY